MTDKEMDAWVDRRTIQIFQDISRIYYGNGSAHIEKASSESPRPH